MCVCWVRMHRCGSGWQGNGYQENVFFGSMHFSLALTAYFCAIFCVCMRWMSLQFIPMFFVYFFAIKNSIEMRFHFHVFSFQYNRNVLWHLKTLGNVCLFCALTLPLTYVHVTKPAATTAAAVFLGVPLFHAKRFHRRGPFSPSSLWRTIMCFTFLFVCFLSCALLLADDVLLECVCVCVYIHFPFLLLFFFSTFIHSRRDWSSFISTLFASKCRCILHPHSYNNHIIMGKMCLQQ